MVSIAHFTENCEKGIVGSAHPTLKYHRAITLLESVLAEMRPDETQLLANYPNPFNPETWLLIIWQTTPMSGFRSTTSMVREYVNWIGSSGPGDYTNRSRAAYWDGKYHLAEQVASGIYFFHLSAGDYSAARKMLIVK